MSSNVEKEPGDVQPEAGTPPIAEKKKREYKDFGHEEEKATRTFLPRLPCRLPL